MSVVSLEDVLILVLRIDMNSLHRYTPYITALHTYFFAVICPLDVVELSFDLSGKCYTTKESWYICDVEFLNKKYQVKIYKCNLELHNLHRKHEAIILPH